MRRNLKTGFEAEAVDEFGTGFEIGGSAVKLALPKFLPQMVAPPEWPGLNPLEAELIGFLQGYRYWPIHLNAQNIQNEASAGKEFTSLYEQAIARWQVVRHMPGAGPWHRVAALAKDLALVHAYSEIRTSASLWHIFQRDKVKFVQRCQPHGGITAFVISTFPAFRELKNTSEGQDIQRALLVALRYHATPTLLPLNGGTLARELVEYMWRADAQLQNLDVRELDQLSPEQLEDLRNNLQQQWPAFLSDLSPQNDTSTTSTCLKLADDSIWLKQETLLQVLAPLLKPSLRQSLGLWDTGSGIQHPAWPHLANLMLEERFVASSHDGQDASNACFNLLLGNHVWGPALKITPDASRYANVLRAWIEIPAAQDMPEVVMDNNQLLAHAQSQAGQIDSRLSELF
ncbi:MAG: hypothetical protein DI585_02295 [Pseudomonas fluorescens]|nr:MAG: hypothetical protein DI585_02295 [Pseudomonas fluorescens]